MGTVRPQPPGNDDELRAAILALWGVRIPNVCVCPNHATPWQAFADAFFARHPVTVWKASRGFGGKTFLLALLGLCEATFLGADVSILGGSGEQSERVHRYASNWWNLDSAPRQVLASDPTSKATRFVYGNEMRALMASTRSVRGPHPQRLRMDEADEMDLVIVDAASGQTLAGRGLEAQTVYSSTHQYADGTMTEILSRAGQRGWPVYEWCYHETVQPHGWLAPSEVERKRAEMPEAMWNAEVELQEPSPEARAINTAAVRAMFCRDLGVFEGAAGQYIEIEPPEPEGRYATGADWARKQDWTIIPTIRIDCKPARVVAFERRGREPWPQMVERFDQRVTRYRGAACHDGTGVGDVVADYMKSRAEAVLMVGRERSNLLTEYIAAVERGDLVSPLIKCMEVEHRLASHDDVYGSGHLPDSIAAMALAWRVAQHGPPRIHF